MAIWIGADGNYNVAANWNPADVPGDTAGETATFADTGSTSVTISGTVIIPAGFTFDANAPAYTISLSGAGTTLAFSGAGIVNNSVVAQNLATATGVLSFIQFQGSSTADDATITINSDGQLEFFNTSSGGSARIIGNGGLLALATSSGTLSIGSLEGSGFVVASTQSGGATTNILTVGSLGTSTTFSGGLFDQGAALGLTKVGAGTLTLSGSSVYTAATTVSAGTLQAGATNAFTDLSAYSVASGATLALNNFSQAIGSLTGVAGASVTLGAGTLTIDGGTTTYAGNITGTGGLVIAAPSLLTLSGTNSYSGATTVNGMLAVSGGNAIGDASAVTVNSAANLFFQASETIGSLAGSVSGSAEGAGTLTVGTDNTSTSFSGFIADLLGAAALTKIGTGTQILSGANIYTGATTVNGGTLQIDGSLAFSTTTVNSGGTLAGSGAVQDVVVNSGGHVAPGASPGSLVTADFTLNAGASLDIEIGGTTAGTQYDQLIVVGTVTLTGTLTSRLIDGFNPANGATFTIIANDSNDAVNGIFAGLSEGDFFTHNGSSYSISYVGGVGGNDVVLTAANDAPVIALDGNLDALVANLNGNNASVLIGNGTGGFTAAAPVGVGGLPRFVTLGDVDSDGDLDALTANEGSNNVSVLIGDGLGGFTAATPIGAGTSPFSVALGDVNGDGDLDALVANRDSDNVSVLIGDGAGGFTAQPTPVGVGAVPASVALGDVNGDGDLDALVANAVSDNVSVLIGDGAGGFAAATPVGVGSGPGSVALGDVNGDGNLDALVANFSGNNVSVLIGDGLGGFTAATPVGVGSTPFSVALGDVDGDGDLDALVANFGSNNVSVLIGDGAGGFTAATPVGVGSGPGSVALGDVNGDGDLDALVANRDSNNVSVLIGDGAGGFTAATPVGAGSGPFSVALGDLNNAQETDEDTAFVFSVAGGNAITLTDDAGVDETVTLEVENGILTLATLAGLTGVSGNGTDTVTFTGTLAEINAALNGLTYAPDDNFNGRDTLTATVNDNASAAQGGAKTATKLVPIIVNAVNDPVTALDDAFFPNETFGVNANILVNNPDGHAFSVTAVNGVGASVGTQITLASGALLALNADGTFVYDPNGAFDALPAAGSGASNLTATDSFTYTVTGGSTATITINITGIDSDDILRGTGGVDVLTGGIGNDRYFVENAGDAVNEMVGQGTDRVFASVSYVLTAGSSVELMSTTNSLGTGAIDLTGNDLADTIYGNAGVNTINGAGGNDVLAGLAGDDTLNGGGDDDRLYGGSGQNDMAGSTGNDWYIVESLTDLITEAAGEGTLDLVFTSLNYTLSAGAHVEIMRPTTTHTAAISLTGNELANSIYGNNNTNVLSGAGGNDLLVGFGGADTLNGGADADTLYGGSDNDILNGDAGADTLTGEAGNDTLNGDDDNDRLFGGAADDILNGGNGNDHLLGEGRNDRLNGGAGNDRLEGGVGGDTLVGGAGDDIYIVTDVFDTILEFAGGGLDRVYASEDYTLAAAAQVEYLATSNIAGTRFIELTGNAFANRIYGNAGDNILSGKGGLDTLTGRGGVDSFFFDTAPNSANRDIITDFNGAQDIIQLRTFAFTALTGNASTALSADQFVIGPDALDANDRIIYDNGALIYDHNGNVAGGEQVIAVLSGRPTLSNTDIFLA